MDRSERDLLQRQIIRRCGDPAERFGRYGHTFGDWVDAAPGAGRAALVEVEAGIAGYLVTAARTGRRWGTAAGLTLGSGAALVAFLVVRLAG